NSTYPDGSTRPYCQNISTAIVWVNKILILKSNTQNFLKKCKVIMGPILLPFMILHLGLHAGLLSQTNDKVAYDIGVAIAVLDGLALAPAFCYILFSNFRGDDASYYSIN